MSAQIHYAREAEEAGRQTKDRMLYLNKSDFRSPAYYHKMLGTDGLGGGGFDRME